MDHLYLLCVIIGCTALVLISAVIPWAVFTRYVLNSAASWPEPLAVLLTIVLTFIGAAAGYRLNLHMNVSYFADQLPARFRPLLDLIVELLMALIAIFMIVWGGSLVEVTWHNTIADFPFLSVGVTYLPIPIGGVCLLLSAFFLGRRRTRCLKTPKLRHSTDPAGANAWISSFCLRPCWSAF